MQKEKDTQSHRLSIPRRRMTIDNKDNTYPLFQQYPRVSLLNNANVSKSLADSNQLQAKRKFTLATEFIPKDVRRRTIQRDEILNSGSYPSFDLPVKKLADRPYPQESKFIKPEPISPMRHQSDPAYLKYSSLATDFNTMKAADIPNTKIIEENKLLSSKVQQLQDRLDTLLDHLHELTNLRYTEAEALFQELKHQSEEKDKVYNKLKEEIETLKALEPNSNRYDTYSGAKNQTEELMKLVSSLEEKNRALESKNRALSMQKDSQCLYDIYENLTGVVVTDIQKSDDGNIFNCIIAGRNGTFQFSLFIPKNPSEGVQYSPVLDKKRNGHFIATLPEFLTEEIEFDLDNLPTFFCRLSTLVHCKPFDPSADQKQ
ncbi:chromosome segregation protein Csm1/Pcs1-domain-containing protein [Pilobolus umbonatus]|nr:chromosome segregation protein Csm1/Pcs1-domain-containing protein [Pilobolus umbonatus]